MRVLVVDGFAESSPVSEAARSVLEASGHEVSVLNLADAGFDAFMSADERRAYHETHNLISPEQQASADLVRSHEALVVCTAIRSGTIEPRVKSWFERVFIPEVSFTFTKGGRITGALKNIRRVAMIVDCPDDDPAPHSRGGSTRSVVRAVRLNCAKTCRSTYVRVHPGVDTETRITTALARW